MKKVEYFIAFDDTAFETEKDCIEYENTEIDRAVQRVHRRMQQLKAGELADEFQLFVRNRAVYREACKKRVSESDRLSKFNRYLNAKSRYLQSVTSFQKLRQDYRNLKKDAKQKALADVTKKEV